MNKRIKAWCYYCGHESAFDIKGVCAQELKPHDDNFPTLTFVQRSYEYSYIPSMSEYGRSEYKPTLVGEREYSIHPDIIRDQYDYDYTFRREWTLMQCLVCLQPTLIEKESLDKKRLFEDLYEGPPYEDPPPQDEVEYSESEFKEEMQTLYPLIKIGQTPPPHEKMPSEVADIFNEARMVFSNSPRASVVLLRFALELFFKQYNFPGGSIDKTLEILEQKNLLRARTIQACDSIRVFGNNGAHPLEININENPDIAQNLFHLLNYVVDDIANAVNVKEMYEKLPEGAKNAIKNRPLKRTKKHQSNHH